jgi:M6 family metalloprotease-like protein
MKNWCFFQLQVFLFIIFLAFGRITSASAAPAAPIDIEIVQPDGSTFIARQWGDEWQNGFETKAGHTILQNSSGWWVYALSDEDGSLAPAVQANIDPMVVGTADPVNLPLHIRPQGSFVPSDALQTSINTPNIGAQPTLVLLASFSDRQGTYTAANFASSIFGATNSVKDYYLDASFNNLTLSPATETHGIANDGVVGWLNLGYAHPNIGGSFGNGQTVQSLVKNVLVAADPYINYGIYDTNQDGYIAINELHLVVVVAGHEASYTNSTPNIWAHRWNLNYVSPPTLDGKILGQSPYGGYALFGEIHQDHQATIGIIAHELGHDLTWPDLYDYDNSSDGVGDWSIMGSGSWNHQAGAYAGSTPAFPDAWLKWYQGWITPTTVNGTLTGVSIRQAETYAEAFLLRPNPGGVNWNFEVTSGTGEFFLVENRQLTGYDAGLPGCGLLIWHIDESVAASNSGSGSINDNENHPLVKVMEADGLNHLLNGSDTNRGDAGDPFPGTSNKVIFDYTSVPNSRLYNGANSYVSVNNISTCAATMTADLTFSSLVQSKNVFLPLTLRLGGAAGNPIRNGTFEFGQNGNWIENSTGGWDLIGQLFPNGITPHGGTWAAWLGGEDDETSSLKQTGLALIGVRYLHYWYWIASEDSCGYDFAKIYINEVEKSSMNLCSSNNTGGWVLGTMDLNSYVGTTISLEFRVATDSSLNSNFFIDDVSISVSATATPPLDEPFEKPLLTGAEAQKK